MDLLRKNGKNSFFQFQKGITQRKADLLKNEKILMKNYEKSEAKNRELKWKNMNLMDQNIG